MSLCPCSDCYCTQTGGAARKAALCLYCTYGEHSAALKEPNRFRICRSCNGESRGLNEWPSACYGCGSPFGPVTLGWDRVSERERGSPLTKVGDLDKAMRAHRRAMKQGITA